MAENSKIRDITFILKDLLKVIKVVTLYPEDNPLPASLRRSFAEKLESLLEDYGAMSFNVDAETLIYENEIIYESKSIEDNLAAIFYDAGITQMTLCDGLFVDEIYRFLDVIKAYINSNDKSLDLLSLMWESSISQIKFRTLEDIALTDYDEGFNLQDFISAQNRADQIQGSQFAVDDSTDYQQIFLPQDRDRIEEVTLDDNSDLFNTDKKENNDLSIFSSPAPFTGNALTAIKIDIDDEVFRTAEAASAMGLNDLPHTSNAVPDTTMILNESFEISQEDEKTIQAILEKDADFDPYESTAKLLKELLHQENEMSMFYETVTICEKIMTEFISHGKLAESSIILSYINALEKKIRTQKPLWAERLKDASVTAGSSERLTVLSEALNNFEDINSIELKKYLSNFSWEALNNITDLLSTVIHQPHKECLVEYLAENGKNNIDFVGKGIYDKRSDVVCNAITILSQIGDKKSLSYLSKLADHRDEKVRLALVTSLKDSPSEKVLEILKRAAFDSSQKIRNQAIESIVSRNGKPAFDTITEIINDSTFIINEQSDQMALLKAYSKLGSEYAVEYLVRLIKRINVLNDSQITFFRYAAFEALVINKSDKCEQELLKLSRSIRPSIKKQAQETLQKRREYMYGGELS